MKNRVKNTFVSAIISFLKEKKMKISEDCLFFITPEEIKSKERLAFYVIIKNLEVKNLNYILCTLLLKIL